MMSIDPGGQGAGSRAPGATRRQDVPESDAREAIVLDRRAKQASQDTEADSRISSFRRPYPLISRIIGEGPTILHLHNLHGGYFDLRALPALSALAPVVLTLHDQWAFTGHCAHSFECERWRSGCGECPDLTIYPGIPKDRTAENFTLKQQIFSRTRLNLSAPSKWLMDKAERSLLAPAIEEARVIPNGVDTSVFRPGDKAVERSRLGLPRGSRIVLCAGSMARSDHWTDRRLLHSTLRYLVERAWLNCTLLFLGSARSSQEKIDGIQVIHRPYERDISRVASYYRASDVYLHPARADTFPTAVLESLACGLPVVATAIGGIPEQVKSLWASNNAPRFSRRAWRPGSSWNLKIRREWEGQSTCCSARRISGVASARTDRVRRPPSSRSPVKQSGTLIGIERS